MKKKIALSGLLAGLLNGILGAGGGVVLVPLLERQSLPAKRAHATAVAIILPLSLVSAGSFWLQGIRVPMDLLGYLLPSGFIGGILGSRLLSTVNNQWLSRGFGALLLYAGARLLLEGGA